MERHNMPLRKNVVALNQNKKMPTSIHSSSSTPGNGSKGHHAHGVADRVEYVKALTNQVNQATTKFKLSNLLIGKKIKGIAFHSDTLLKVTPDGEILAPAIAESYGFLTLKDIAGVEKVNKIPLYMLDPSLPQNFTQKFFEMKDVEIDWESSYITIAQNIPAASIPSGSVYMLSVFYDAHDHKNHNHNNTKK